MGKSSHTILLLCNFMSMIFLLEGCGDQSEEITIQTPENLLAGLWEYEYILSDTDTVEFLNEIFQTVDASNEIQVTPTELGLKYFANHSYEFRWGRNQFQLFYGDSVNFQPNLGFWDFSDDGNELAHNKAREFEVIFDILELTENRMVRVSQHFDELKGEWVLWTEVLKSETDN